MGEKRYPGKEQHCQCKQLPQLPQPVALAGHMKRKRDSLNVGLSKDCSRVGQNVDQVLVLHLLRVLPCVTHDQQLLTGKIIPSATAQITRP